ncbi:ATP-binding protein [Flavihumibacter stibioxidans]|uniref:histidine kinase n=1 Tax=Flavihumibacter stibioxidans TaxID=1834163 RepID=A0ABR7M815_9BACT|nr:sensor histidine kinase [Flavihumibacter stibioxidans]MBC6491107.1 histidine kinase [Flavihumibacter stibioxidans]
MNNWVTIGTAILYLGILSVIAWYAEKRKKMDRSLINNGYVYALSMAVYCTAWTYYGSVGRASTNGIEFLSIYLGPTIMCALFWPVLRKIIRISKTQRINSIADLVSTRYGKNFSIAVVVTICCVVGIIPYISLQLKAISASFDMLTNSSGSGPYSLLNDSTIYITLLLTLFIIFFGTRSVDASEKHEGLVAAIAFESVIKLVAFLAAGLVITYGIFDGIGDIFTQASVNETLRKVFVMDTESSYSSWVSMIFLSMMAIFFLPRQFQVNVVENLKENHLNKASWFFPLYLLVINIFVLPIALGGALMNPAGSVDPDMYVLSLPLSHGMEWLSLFIFIGGFSAATGMIIVETLALTTMISNNLALPILFSSSSIQDRRDGSPQTIILWVRRISIVLVLALSLLYDKLIAQQFSLVSIGLVSFAAVAQLAPAVLGGIYWKGASKNGAMAGLITGFLIWVFTLVVPSLASAGLVNDRFLNNGLFGQSWLRPYSLFGLDNFDPVSHSLFWSLLLNAAVFFITSIYSRKGLQETYQGEIFVDIFRQSAHSEGKLVWKGNASLNDLRSLLQNFLGGERADKLLNSYSTRHKIDLSNKKADPRLVSFTEKILSGVIGSASAHIMVSSVAKTEKLSIDEVINMLRESQQVIELNRELRRKSQELTKATQELTNVNRQLKEIDEVKDEFLYTVTHELRTPLTSIRALAEIVHDNPDMPVDKQQQFLGSVISETERLSHLITQVLNLERYESGRQKVHASTVNIGDLIRDVADSTSQLRQEKSLQLHIQMPDSMVLIECDKDLIRQVLYNLLSNAIKFTPPEGRIRITTRYNYDELQVWVCDSGKGIPIETRDLIFDKFFQARNQTLTKPEGSGLGLAICKRIIELHKGKIWAETSPEGGACFIFTLPSMKTFFLNG